jgi:hypothetical protein
MHVFSKHKCTVKIQTKKKREEERRKRALQNFFPFTFER